MDMSLYLKQLLTSWINLLSQHSQNQPLGLCCCAWLLPRWEPLALATTLAWSMVRWQLLQLTSALLRMQHCKGW